MFGRRKEEPTIVHINGNIEWRFAFDPIAKVYIGVCEPLNLNAIGDTWIELQQCANEALVTLLRDLFRSGEFERFLRANGWQASSIPVPGTTPQFDMPFEVRRTNNVQELVAAHA